MRDAARHACRAATRNGCYPPEVAVAAIGDSVAALTQLAGQIGPYVGDFWATAAGGVQRAVTLLAEARGELDAARHHITLTPAEGVEAPHAEALHTEGLHTEPVAVG
jgi:hypothetical protein